MKNRYYSPNNLPNRIVYHTQKEFIRDMMFLSAIITIGVVTAITGFIMMLKGFTPDL